MLWLMLVLCQNPEPPPLPIQPLSITGKWNMIWGAGEYKTEFYKEGGYTATDGTTVWLGAYEWKGNTLEVKEFVDPGPTGKIGYILHWTAEVQPGKRCGTLSGGGQFSLAAIKP